MSNDPLFWVNDLVIVVDPGERQHGYIGRVKDVDLDFSRFGPMAWVEGLADANGVPFPEKHHTENWFFFDQLRHAGGLSASYK